MSSRDARGAVIKKMIVFCLFIAVCQTTEWQRSLDSRAIYPSPIVFSAPKGGARSARSGVYALLLHRRASEHTTTIPSQRIVKSNENRRSSVSMLSKESQCPDRLFALPWILSSGYWGAFQGDKAAGTWITRIYTYTLIRHTSSWFCAQSVKTQGQFPF
jgi:hypothetical protein